MIRSSYTNTRSTRVSVCHCQRIPLFANWLFIYFGLFRVHSHPATTRISFCEGVERDTLYIYILSPNAC
jgi:hypothetical protein